MIISISKLKKSTQMLLDIEPLIRQEFDLRKNLPTTHCAFKFTDVQFIFGKTIKFCIVRVQVL
jgi:hypothetical protein